MFGLIAMVPISIAYGTVNLGDNHIVHKSGSYMYLQSLELS